MLEINRIYNEDCIGENGMRLIADKSVDMILCDLPYGTTKCAWDAVIPFTKLWEQYKRIIKENGAVVLTATQPFTSALGSSNLSWLRYNWVWVKSRATSHLNAKKRPLKSCEDILVFYAKQPTYNPQGLVEVNREVMNSKSDSLRGKDNRTSTVSGGIKHQKYLQQFTNYPRQVLEFASEGLPEHPTQKPVALFEYLIKTYTNEGELVLDNCMGSGTTAVACKNLGRNFIGFETDKKYYDIALRRLA